MGSSLSFSRPVVGRAEQRPENPSLRQSTTEIPLTMATVIELSRTRKGRNFSSDEER
jgi:hypothetical protein